MNGEFRDVERFLKAIVVAVVVLILGAGFLLGKLF